MEWKDAKRQLLKTDTRRKAYRQVDLAYEIGKMITDARIARNITQAKLAELVGTKQPSIARLEKGADLPSLSFLQKIAKAFNTQLLPPRFEFLEQRMEQLAVVPTRLVASSLQGRSYDAVRESIRVEPFARSGSHIQRSSFTGELQHV